MFPIYKMWTNPNKSKEIKLKCNYKDKRKCIEEKVHLSALLRKT